jgi:hypothetical protein
MGPRRQAAHQVFREEYLLYQMSPTREGLIQQLKPFHARTGIAVVKLLLETCRLLRIGRVSVATRWGLLGPTGSYWSLLEPTGAYRSLLVSAVASVSTRLPDSSALSSATARGSIGLPRIGLCT